MTTDVATDVATDATSGMVENVRAPASEAGDPRPHRGLAVRIAAVALVTSGVAVAILALGVWVVGGQAFERLMVEAGASADHAHAMFDQSVTGILVVTIGIAILASALLALVLARRLMRPLDEVTAAAQRVADGDYAARVPREGPAELVSLVDSFNQMAASLEEQERVRRDFIANAAHELRTPLTNLSGYLEGLRDGVITADRATYDSLLEETGRLVRLAHSLDDLAESDRADTGPAPVEVDLSAQLAAAVELVRPALAAREISVSREWPHELHALVSPDHLAQVLANLLQNASRYTPDGGTVTVRAATDAGGLVVSVINTGSPIPEGDLPRVFERFYRVEKSRDRARGGAGIGLAIVKQLVEAWGGRVGAASDATGTTFWFTIPAAPAGPSQHPSAAVAPVPR